ncbi:hypothetical protein D1007_22168 [Hordeum vulgare]|nr:hypothetical protein D1007_22168 [Hordeum vulgare]
MERTFCRSSMERSCWSSPSPNRHLEPEVCKYRAPLLPFCKSWSCKPVCKLEAAIYRARLQEHECIKGGIKSICYCLFCRKHWELD